MAVSLTGRSKLVRVDLAVLLVAALFLAACSSSSGDSGSGKNTTLTWGSGVVTMIDAVGFTAMGLKAFDKYHLDVRFTNGPSAPTLLTTGKADIIRTRYTDVPLLINQGKPVKALATVAVGTPVGLLGGNNVKSIEDLAAMGDRCTIAGAATGSFYAYPRWWAKKYGLKCKIVLVSDYGLALTGVVAGRYSAAPELVSNAGAVLADKKAHWLVDPNAPDHETNGDALPFDEISSIFGATSEYLKSHQDVVARFIKALQETETKMKTMTNEQIAQAIKDSGATVWASQSVDQIVNQLTGNGQAKNVFELDGLNIAPLTEELWKSNLEYVPNEGIELDPSDAKFNYRNAVDNTAFTAG
jgi:ABC-type nitrate/sulfonate/bicarbonate transport system substrate-binding protein